MPEGWVAPNEDYPPPKAGEPPLHEAVRTGDHERIRRLVAEGAPVDDVFDVALDPGGRRQPVTALAQAAGSADGATGETLLVLLDLGASLGPPDGGFPALWYACGGMGWNYPAGGDAERVAVLLAAGDDATWATPDRHGRGGTSLLAHAAASGDPDRLALLLTAGADPDPAGTTTPSQWPLYEAVRSGSVETVHLLLDRAVEINRLYDPRDEPLLAEARSLAMLDVLLGAGARIEAQRLSADEATESAERTLLAIAESSKIDDAQRADMVRRLVDALELPKAVLDGALHRAAFAWRSTGVETLLDVGADPRGTPRILGAACFGCSYEPSPTLERVIDLLLEAGLDPDDEDSNGFRPLHTALSPDTFGPDYQESDGFNAPAALALIRHGASVDVVFPDTDIPPLEGRPVVGFTALHAAALQGASDVVEELLERGADAKARTPDGLTATDLARLAYSELTDPEAWKPEDPSPDATPSRRRRAERELRRWAERIEAAHRCVDLLSHYQP